MKYYIKIELYALEEGKLTNRQKKKALSRLKALGATCIDLDVVDEIGGVHQLSLTGDAPVFPDRKTHTDHFQMRYYDETLKILTAGNVENYALRCYLTEHRRDGEAGGGGAKKLIGIGRVDDVETTYQKAIENLYPEL